MMSTNIIMLGQIVYHTPLTLSRRKHWNILHVFFCLVELAPAPSPVQQTKLTTQTIDDIVLQVLASPVDSDIQTS